MAQTQENDNTNISFQDTWKFPGSVQWKGKDFAGEIVRESERRSLRHLSLHHSLCFGYYLW